MKSFDANGAIIWSIMWDHVYIYFNKYQSRRNTSRPSLDKFLSAHDEYPKVMKEVQMIVDKAGGFIIWVLVDRKHRNKR